MREHVRKCVSEGVCVRECVREAMCVRECVSEGCERGSM